MNFKSPKTIIGLGNPGPNYYLTRHNIGFRILDALAEKYKADWRSQNNLESAQITIENTPVLLIKPQTFMNNSGQVVSYLTKKGIVSEDALVVHDELELPFGKIQLKFGGSARGHNGLKSIISVWSDKFARLRFGIGRPEIREQVPDYVLQKFKEDPKEVDSLINRSINDIEKLYNVL